MNTVFQIVLLIIGFIMLIKGADIFVDGSVSIATRLKIPKIIIGLTIVSMGTGTPEVVIGIIASAGGSSDLAVGNIIGSNIFNLLFIVGLCAMIRPIAAEFKDIAKDYWVSVAGATALLIFMLLFGDFIPRYIGMVFVFAFVIYMAFLVRQAMNRSKKEPELEETKPKTSPVKNIFLVILGLVLIIIGAHFAVSSAESLALTLGLSERVIGITIIAVGTSLPELAIFLISGKKGENDIAISVIIGSNIFNILFVLGISGIVMPLAIDSSMKIDLVVLIVGKLLFMLFSITGKKITRLEGLVFSLIYIVYIAFIVL